MLTSSHVNMAGRNNTGHVVFRTRGSRAYKRLRVVDHHRYMFNIPGIIGRIEYDPNRSSYISLIIFANGVCEYLLSASESVTGQFITSYYAEIASFLNYHTGLHTKFNIGDCCTLEYMPRGTVMFDVERNAATGGSLARAGGTYCILLKKYTNMRKCLLQIPSKQQLSIAYVCRGTKGVSACELHYRVMYGNAGVLRRRGSKPTVRGVAQNPVDHAHGGGEGKKSNKCFPRTA